MSEPDQDKMRAAIVAIGAALEGCTDEESARVLAAASILVDVPVDVALALYPPATPGAAANTAFRAFAKIIEREDLTARDDEYGHGWNAAIAYVADKLRGRRITDASGSKP